MRAEALHLVAKDESDGPFLADLFLQTRRGSFAALGWDEASLGALLRSQFEIREAQYRTAFPNALTRKILVDGEAVGRVDTARSEGRLHIIDLAVTPAAQGQGTGSAALRLVLDEADEAGLVADLHVEALNPARRLYGRAGFTERSDDGVYVFLEREPAPLLNHSSRRSA